MEIELQKQDYEVKKSFTIPPLLQKLMTLVSRYGNLHIITTLCLLGYFVLDFFLGPAGALYWGAMVTGVEQINFFRFTTSIFLHGSFLHIAVNLLSLFSISKQLQLVWSKPQLFILFFTSAWLANLGGFFSYNYLGMQVSAVGASGGLFGLLGAMTSFFLFHKGIQQNQRNNYIKQLIPILILNLLIGLFVPQIAFIVHLYGLIIGLVFGFILEKLPYNAVHNRPYFWTIVWVLTIIGILLCCAIATIDFMGVIKTLPRF